MNKQKVNVLLVFSCLVIVATIIGCGAAGDGFLIPLGGLQFQFFPAKFAFLFNGDADSTISSYSVNASTGALTMVTSSMPTNLAISGCCDDNAWMDVDPNSKFLFVPNLDANTVSVFTIGADGSLTGPVGTDVSSGGSEAYAAKLHPSGKFLYVTNRLSPNIQAFSVGANGVLSPIGSPQTTTSEPHLIIMDWQGRYLYVTHASWYGDTTSNNSLDGFSIDSQTGALTSIGNFSTGVGVTPRGGMIDYSGKFLILANRGNDNNTSDPAGGDPGSVSVFEIQSNGTLTSVGKFVDPACTSTNSCGPFNVVEAIIGGTTYIAADNLDSNSISVFTLDTASGKLTPVSGTPFLTSSLFWPHVIAVDTSGSFGYIGDWGSSGGPFITQFTLNSSGAPSQSGTNVTNGVVDPTQLIFSH